MALRRAIFNNSVSGLCITKLDVLDGLEYIRLCIGYRRAGEDLLMPPLGAEAFSECEPVYVDMPGWQESTVGAKRFEDLPGNAQSYLRKIEEVTETPLDIVSTGPDRKDTIILRHPLD